MKKNLFILLFSFVTIGWSNHSNFNYQQYPGTNLRGQISIHNNGQIVPFAYARVDLLFYDGNGFRIIATVSTDVSGVYFFRYVIPNAYTIQINGNKGFNVQVMVIDYRYYSFQELGQFVY